MTDQQLDELLEWRKQGALNKISDALPDLVSELRAVRRELGDSMTFENHILCCDTASMQVREECLAILHELFNSCEGVWPAGPLQPCEWRALALLRAADLIKARIKVSDPDTSAEEERENTRLFPITGGPSIPWRLMVPHERQALLNHGQSLERLAERGGLAPIEAMAVLMDMSPTGLPGGYLAADALVWLRGHLDNDAYRAGLRDARSDCARIAEQRAQVHEAACRALRAANHSEDSETYGAEVYARDTAKAIAKDIRSQAPSIPSEEDGK